MITQWGRPRDVLESIKVGEMYVYYVEIYLEGYERALAADTPEERARAFMSVERPRRMSEHIACHHMLWCDATAIRTIVRLEIDPVMKALLT